MHTINHFKLLSTTVALALCFSSTVLASPLKLIPPPSNKVKEPVAAKLTLPAKAEKKATPEKKVEIPAVEFWTEAGSNNHLKAAFDEKHLVYDKNTGIITTWVKWTYTTSSSKAAKTIYLRSRYDVRVKTYSDLEQITVDGMGNIISRGTVADQSWNPISPDTLGADICDALTKYLVAM